MNEDLKTHLPRVIGVILIVGILSVVTVLFFAVSAEEEGIIRKVISTIPILRDLVGENVKEVEENSEGQAILGGEGEVSVSIDFEQSKDKVDYVVSDKVEIKENKSYLSDYEDTRKGEDLFHSLRLKEAKQAFILAQDTDPVANYFLALLSAYEMDFVSVKAFVSRVETLKGSHELIIKTKEILKAFDEWNLYPGSTNDHLATLIGRMFLNVGEVKIGIIKLKESIKVNPNYKDAYVVLGAALMMVPDYVEAEKYLTDAMPTDRSEPNFYLGLARFNQGKYKESILAFQEASKLGYNPESDLRTKLGEAYMATADYEKAIMEFNRVLEINPLDVAVYFKPIYINLKFLNNIEKALSYAELCLKNNPNSALSQHYIGYVYYEGGSYDLAKKYFSAALAIDPELLETHYHIGLYYESIGDFENASSSFKKVVNSAPNSKYARDALNELKKMK